MAKKKKTKEEVLENEVLVNQKSSLKYKIDLKCKNKKQKELVETIKENKITFVQGVFGVGKTFVINSVALDMLKDPTNNIEKIVCLVPTVQNGAHAIGLLPGTLEEKVGNYAINEIDSFKKILRKSENAHEEQIVANLISSGKIEIRPISFLRGASLENSFICVSEAENFTKEEMFLILTRFESGKMVISGDPLQADRGEIKKGNSGLLHGVLKLGDVDGVGIVKFSDEDIVRNDILIDIYKKWKD